MNPDDEWAEWSRDFRAGAEAGAPSPAAMLARVRRETRRQTLAYAVEILAGACLVAFYVAMLGRVRETWFVALASANFVFAAAWVGYLTLALRGTWTAAGRDARSFLALTRARRESQRRWYRFSRGATAALLLFIVGWAPFLLRARWERYAAEPWRAVVGLGAALAIGVAVMVHQTRRIERATRALDALDPE